LNPQPPPSSIPCQPRRTPTDRYVYSAPKRALTTYLSRPPRVDTRRLTTAVAVGYIQPWQEYSTDPRREQDRQWGCVVSQGKRICHADPKGAKISFQGAGPIHLWLVPQSATIPITTRSTTPDTATSVSSRQTLSPNPNTCAIIEERTVHRRTHEPNPTPPTDL